MFCVRSTEFIRSQRSFRLESCAIAMPTVHLDMVLGPGEGLGNYWVLMTQKSITRFVSRDWGGWF